MKLFTNSVFALTILLLGGCAKDTFKPQTVKVKRNTVALASTGSITVSPERSVVFGAITISGSGFGVSAANVQVKFNGVIGIVNSVNDNKIVATVPANASSGKISITVGGNTVSTVNTLSVLNLVKEFSSNNPIAIRFMDFDKTGNGNIYAGTTTAIYKITSLGRKSLLFNVPANDTTRQSKGGFNYAWTYHYNLRGLVTATDGNIYAFVQKNYNNYEPEVGYYYDVTMGVGIYKITSDGHSSLILGQFSKFNDDPTAGPYISHLLEDVYASTIDNNGNIYISSGYIYKIDRFGNKTKASSGTTFYAPGLVADSHNNLLVSLGNILGNITPPGIDMSVIAGSDTSTAITGPGKAVKLFQSAGFTIDNNDNVFMISLGDALHKAGIAVVNSAGYVNLFNPGFAINYQDQVYFDKPAQKLYYVGNGGYNLTRYSLK